MRTEEEAEELKKEIEKRLGNLLRFRDLNVEQDRDCECDGAIFYIAIR